MQGIWLGRSAREDCGRLEGKIIKQKVKKKRKKGRKIAVKEGGRRKETTEEERPSPG